MAYDLGDNCHQYGYGLLSGRRKLLEVGNAHEK